MPVIWNNLDIERYHKKGKLDSFSANLTIMQDSKLFKVFELGADLYKIIPLFYVDEIKCNDDSIKIMDNKAIIMHEDNTTYIDFINIDKHGDDDNTGYELYKIDNTQRKSLTLIKQVGDTLTDLEYNNLFYLMQKHTTFYDTVRLKKSGTTVTEFGEYTFTITNARLIDKGFIVKEDSTVIKCELNNPLFPEHRYNMRLYCVQINDVNIDSSHITDNTVEGYSDPVELVEGEEVTLDWDASDNGLSIVFFDAQVEMEKARPWIDVEWH